ncbi:MAG: hypothetical protein ACKO9I_02690 [Sphaerospermopsis kisseleviana]
MIRKHKIYYPVTSHQSPVTSHQSPVTSPQSPVPSHQSPVTNHQSPHLHARLNGGIGFVWFST